LSLLPMANPSLSWSRAPITETLAHYQGTPSDSYEENEHKEPVYAVAWSPTGKYVASGSNDQTLRVWDTTTWKTTKILKGHEGGVQCLAWSPDGQLLASGGEDLSIRVWDWQAELSIISFPGHSKRVTGLDWSPDGARLASSSWDKTIKIWDFANEELLHTLEAHEWQTLCVSWSPDGSRLLSSANDNTARIWDSNTGTSLATLTNHEYGIYSAAWSPNGKRVATASADRTVNFHESRLSDAIDMWHGEYFRDSVYPVVEGLFYEHILPDQVLKAIESANVFSVEQYKLAKYLVKARVTPKTADLSTQAWELVNPERIVKNTDVAYALRLIEAALPLLDKDDKEAWLYHSTHSYALAENQRFDDAVLAGKLSVEVAPEGDKKESALFFRNRLLAMLASQHNEQAWPLIDPDREDQNTDVALALDLVRKAAEWNPEEAMVIDTLAWALYANELFDEAIAAGERALELCPEEQKDVYAQSLDYLKGMIPGAQEF